MFSGAYTGPQTHCVKETHCSAVDGGWTCQACRTEVHACPYQQRPQAHEQSAQRRLTSPACGTTSCAQADTQALPPRQSEADAAAVHAFAAATAHEQQTVHTEDEAQAPAGGQQKRKASGAQVRLARILVLTPHTPESRGCCFSLSLSIAAPAFCWCRAPVTCMLD